MANAVFDYTQDALATLVSPRAAKRVLDEALTSANDTPDTVSVPVMQALLTGYIRFELEQMLPREGLQGQLEQLSARLVHVHDVPEDDSESDKAVNTTDAMADLADFTRMASAEANKASSQATNKPPKSKTPESKTPESKPPKSKTPESKPSKSKPPVAMWKDQFAVANKAARLKGITMADSTETKLTLSEAQLESIVMRFAQVEHAKLIAAVRENGTIVTSRGAGVDLNSLSRFGLMGLRLLERSGELRSYYLAHSQGQLFLFCFGKDTVIMLGSSDINVGTVFATLSSVKESL